MKILFVTEHYFPNRNANGNCVWNLVQEMQKQGHVITVLSKAIGQQQTLLKKDGQTSLEWYRCDADMQTQQILSLLKEHLFKGIIAGLSAVFGRFFLSYGRKNPPSLLKTQVIQKAIMCVCSKAHYDIIIAAIFPLETALACANLKKGGKLNTPYVVYQLDSYIDNATLNMYNRAKRIKIARDIYDGAASVFAHLLQHDEIAIVGAPTLQKTSFVEFPTLLQRKVDMNGLTSNQFFHEDGIHCAFFGRLYPKMRDPNYSLAVFSTMSNHDIHLHIFGETRAIDFSAWKVKLAGRLHLHAAVDSSTCFALMQEVDALINIENAIENQLPSKIFEYFSTGKPILDFSEFQGGTAIPYMQRYENACILIKDDAAIEVQAKQAMEFLQYACKKPPTEMDAVNIAFYDAIPKTVASLILSRL